MRNWRHHGILPATLSAAVSLAGAPGCTSGTSATTDLAATVDLGGAAGPADLGPRSTYQESEAAAARTACTFKSGTLPGLSLAADAPLGPQIPIDTIVVLMLENRSFDHLLSNLPAVGQKDVEVAPANASNADSKGIAVPRYHDTDYCFEDTNHEWVGAHAEYNGGKNDGFVTTNEDPKAMLDGHRAMSYYTEDDVPVIYGLASTFAIADHYFSSLLGPTYPNREFAYAATSFGHTTNALVKGMKPTIMASLESAGIDWHFYSEQTTGLAIFYDTWAKYIIGHTDPTPNFYLDAKAGSLAPVVFVDADFKDEDGGGDDWHPPGDVQNADTNLLAIIDALVKSPQWPHMAIFITFDENGGIYDHVAPPPACPPDDIAPDDPSVTGAKFDRYGFRVPLVVVSPYAKPHFVSHKVYDHTSILRFIEARHVLPALTARDANADPLLDLFDWKAAPVLSPTLPTAKLDAAKLAACKARFPRK